MHSMNFGSIYAGNVVKRMESQPEKSKTKTIAWTASYFEKKAKGNFYVL